MRYLGLETRRYDSQNRTSSRSTGVQADGTRALQRSGRYSFNRRGAGASTRSAQLRCARAWRPKGSWRSVFGRRDAQVALSILAITTLLASAVPISDLLRSSARADSSLLPNYPAPYYPYLLNASSYPAADYLGDARGHVYFPQVTSQSVGNATVYELVYAVNVSGVGSILELATGAYNASFAQTEFQTNGCSSALCSHHVPIQWTEPTPIAVFGSGQMIQADAVALYQSCLAVAATVGDRTSVYIADSSGGTPSFTTLTGPKPISGGSPQLAIENSSVMLTTLNPNLNITLFTNICPMMMPAPEIPGGFGEPQFVPSLPTVSAVIPYRDMAGASVAINGTNLSGATEVLFGGTQALFSVSGSQVLATVPSGSGSVNVIVENSEGASSSTCSSLFAYGSALPTGTPQVDGVSPAGGKAGTVVTVDGVYFTQASHVYFGNTEATSSYVSQGVMHATAPSGLNGTFNVTVANTVGVSAITCADEFDFQPVVTGLVAAEGASGNAVAIYGSFFTSSSGVDFGGTASSKVKFVSSTELKAKAPAGTGTENVQVKQGNTLSATDCEDEYTYGTTPSPGAPQILSLSPTAGVSGRMISVNGVNLTNQTNITFGGVPGWIWRANSSTQLEVVVPLGNGTVPVAAGNPEGLSAPVCEDQFTINSPPVSKYLFVSTAKEYPSYSAQPVRLSTLGMVVFAANRTSDQIVMYNFTSSDTGIKFQEHPIVSFNDSVGSSIFTTLGDTNTSVSDSDPGRLSVIASGTSIMVLYTTNGAGETLGEVIVSGNSGTTWQGPYAVPVTDGSMQDPELSLTQAGYVYVDFVDAQGTSWSVWQAVMTGSGRLIFSPSMLPGSLQSTGLPNASLGVAVDPFERPIIVWGSLARGQPLIAYTGGFGTARAMLQLLWAGFNDTRASDYQAYGGPGISEFQGLIQSQLSTLNVIVGSGASECQAIEMAAGELYPNITTIDPGFTELGPPPGGCREAIGADNSILSQAQVGALSADVYLSVESETLLEAIGYASMPSPTWSWAPGPSGFGNYTPDSSAVANVGDDAVQVNATTLNPNSVWLHVASYLGQTNSSTKQLWYNSSGSSTYCGSNTTRFTPVDFWTNLSVVAQPGAPADHWSQSYWYPAKFISPYVTNLTPLRNGSWWINATVKFLVFAVTSVNETLSACSIYHPFEGIVPSGRGGSWPGSPTFRLRGTYTTGLSQYPIPEGLTSPYVNSYNNTNDTDDDQVIWNNTIEAHARAWINSSAPSEQYSWTNTSNSVLEDAHGGHWSYLTPNVEYSLTAVVETSSGGTNGSWGPDLDTSQVSQPAYPITTHFSCPTFTQQYNPLKVWWYGSAGEGEAANISNLTPTSATITWYSSGQGTAYLTGVDFPQNDTFQQDAASSSLPNGSYQYVAQLHGLDAWGSYRIHIHLTQSDGCLRYFATFAGFWALDLPAEFPISETDENYDSITREGGGALVTWQVPYNFTLLSKFENGSFIFFPANESNDVTSQYFQSLSPLAIETSGWLGGGSATTYQLNLSPALLNPGWAYDATLFLNYSVPTWGGQIGNLVAWSYPLRFVYLNDSSGDGLSNAEKRQGWNVVVNGRYVNRTYASIDAWATNGLVNDYVEKEYGLNATVLDSAQSGMLDTWNLTFLLGEGTKAPLCPKEFNCWYANSTDPFDSPAYPGATPVRNYSINTVGARHDPVDDSNYSDANILWEGNGTAVNDSDDNNTALGYLQSLIANQSFTDWTSRDGGWNEYRYTEDLRAVVGCLEGSQGCGNDSGLWTLTVWGKLSWGANPLNTSTPGDGIPDGARVNPLMGSALNLTVTGWTESGLSSGEYIAAYESVKSPGASYTSNTTDYSGYSLSKNAQGFSGQYVENFPVAPTQQYARLNFSLDYANSHGGITALCSSSQYAVDLFNASTHSRSCSSGANSVVISYRAYAVSAYNPTYLVVPTGNGTLDSLPLGLQRYAGETDFDLLEVEVNSSLTAGSRTSFTSPSLGYPLASADNGVRGSYTVTMSEGLTNILVPRSLFLSSPFGQAMLNQNGVKINSTPEDSDLQTSWTPGIISNRTTGGNYTNASGKYSFGPVNGSMYIKIFGSSDPNCTAYDRTLNLCGGVPGDPGAENGTQTLAVGAVILLNITNQTNFDALLAGLLLNRSGNVTGWMSLVTSYLPTLGLPTVVYNALSDSTQFSSGTYGAPTYQAPASGPLAGWGSLWNSNFGWLSSAITAAWNYVTEFADYVAGLAEALASWAISAFKQTVQFLEAVAGAAAYLLQELSSLVKKYALSLLDPPIKAIEDAASSYDTAVSAAFNATISDVYNGGRENGAVSSGHALALLSNLGGSILILATSVGVAVFVLLALIAPLSLGAAFLISILLGLLVFGALAAFAAITGAILLNALGIWAIDQLANDTYQANKGSLQQVDWRALAGSVGALTSGADIPAAVAVAYSAQPEAKIWNVVAFSFDVASWVASLFAWAQNVLSMAVIALVFAGLATTFTGLAYASVAANPLFDDIDIGLSFTALSAASFDFGADL